MFENFNFFRFDPWCLLQAFKNKAISLGVEYVDGNVVGFNYNPHLTGMKFKDADSSHDAEVLKSVRVSVKPCTLKGYLSAYLSLFWRKKYF